MKHRDAIRDAMTELGKRPDVLFVGQTVACAGSPMRYSLEGVPADKLIEFPVCENTQLGFSTGLALAGFTVISVFPRFNFLLSAFDQLVNHLDKLPEMGYRPKVVVRVAVGSDKPMDPGPQHKSDFTHALEDMCDNVVVDGLNVHSDVADRFRQAVADAPSVVVEHVANHDKEQR